MATDLDVLVAQVLEQLLPILERGIDTTVEVGLAKGPHWSVVPATIVGQNGSVAEVIADDDPDDTHEATRLDEFQGVPGGIIGLRARTLLLRIPPSGFYCLGAIPDTRIDDPQDNPGFFTSGVDGDPLGAGVTTDMIVHSDIAAGYIYRVVGHGGVSFATAAQVYRLHLRENGTIISSIGRWSAAVTGAGPTSELGWDGVVEWVAADDLEQAEYSVWTSSGNGGIMQVDANTDEPRTLSITCLGPARGVPAQ
jgi:hypothetical protein